MDKLFSEILEEFESSATRAEKIAVLRKYDHPRLRDFLAITYNPDIVYDVEIPVYRNAVEPAGLNFTYLDVEVPKLYRFIKNHPKSQGVEIEPKRKKQLLVVVLESLHKDEAALLVKSIKNKDLGVKYLTPKLIKEAFPEINIPV